MRLTPDELRSAVAGGDIAEVLVALPDLQGRLQGLRLDAEHFLDHVLDGTVGACTYLLEADVDMVAWSPGRFGDMDLRPDPQSIRRLPWESSTACVLADALGPEGRPRAIAPRAILARQLERLAELGFTVRVGTELEFLAFRESYREAAARRWHDLEPLTAHNVDYAISGVGELEALGREIRDAMRELGLRVESARAECHPGQYEIVFRHRDALTACDEHVLYKTGAKAIAERRGVAITFMPKFDGGEGNSCHVHLSLWHESGASAFQGGGPGGRSPAMDDVLAGQLACLPDFTLLFAPTINAYKRLRPGAFAPSTASWGTDDRTCAIRVAGRGGSLRFEHRVSGGDANPYLVVAGLVAAAVHGLTARPSLPGAERGGVPSAGAPRLPATLADACERWRASPAAREAFGAEVVEHLARAADAELRAFGAHVTDWERERAFARL